VVEIGAGTGVLTEALARRAGRVVAIEYDPRVLLERADLILQEQAARRYTARRPGGPGDDRLGGRLRSGDPPVRGPAWGRFCHPGLPLRRGLVPPFTYRQLRRLARELGFGLDARPADLDAVQWAGLYAFLARPPHLGRRAQSP
jgi:hypothetical protein